MIYKITLPDDEMAFYQTWLFLWSCSLDGNFSDEVFVQFNSPDQLYLNEYDRLFKPFDFVTIVDNNSVKNHLLNDIIVLPIGYIRIPNSLLSTVKANTDIELPSNMLPIHDKLVPQLMLDPSSFEKEIVPFVRKINNAITPYFNNIVFWNLRYRTNTKLGSGVGSRGPFLLMKRAIYKNCGIELAENVLDIGCGDIEIVKSLQLQNYVGVDSSSNAITLAQKKKPNWTFFLIPEEISKITPCEVVLCIDVLIHQNNIEDYKQVIELAIRNCKQRLIISGFDKYVTDSYMISYYENLSNSLSKYGFARVTKVLEYNNTSLFVADKESCQLPEVNAVDSGLVFSVLSNYLLRQFEKELFI